MSEVFLLYAYYDFQGSKVLAAFKNEDDAIFRLQGFQSYLETSPGLPPRVDDKGIEEALWNEYEAWLLSAPEGFDSNADEYVLRKFELE